MFRRHKFQIPEPDRVKAKSESPVSPYLALNHHDESNWLVSYADMMTLLCGFFIMMFAISTVDKHKYETVKKEIAHEFGGKYEKPATAALAGIITQVIDEAGVKNQTSVKYDPSGVSVSFQATVFFDTLSADVKPEGRTVIDKLIDALAKRQTSDKREYQIVVEGHTDSRPILSGSFPSNWELSGARAARVVRLFLDRGFSPEKLTAIGYGDTRPEFPSRTPSGTWDEDALSKNRRVVLRILSPDVNSVPLATAAVPATPATAAQASTGQIAADASSLERDPASSPQKPATPAH